MAGRANRAADPIHVIVRATEASGTGTLIKIDVPAAANDSMTVAQLKDVIHEAMEHSEVAEAELGKDAWGLQLYGRALNEAFPLAAYHPQNGDVLYLRLHPGQHDSEGHPINIEEKPEAAARYTKDLKADLKAVGAFRPGLTFLQLVECWRHHQQKVTRPERLTEAVATAACHSSVQVRRCLGKIERDTSAGRAATAKLLDTLYADIDHYGDRETGELDATGGLDDVLAVRMECEEIRRWRLAPAPPRAARRRFVYVCATELERTYDAAMLATDEDLASALCLFDVERAWLFPPQPKAKDAPEHASSRSAQAQLPYMRASEDFKQLVLSKEERGLVHFFRPHRNWSVVSSWLEGITDPVSGHALQPLELREARWLSMAGSNGWQGDVRQDGRKNDPDAKPRFTTSVSKVASVIRSGSFDYAAVCELLYQSNRNLDPQCGFAPPLHQHKLTKHHK